MLDLFTYLMVATSVVTACGDIQGKTNSLVNITLDANPTTGYQWMIQEIPSQLVYVNTAQDTSDCATGMVGCPSKTVLNFYASSAGEGTLKLIYGRYWDKTTWQERDCSVHISD